MISGPPQQRVGAQLHRGRAVRSSRCAEMLRSAGGGPGVTAAVTTAALATGAGPGVTALATTAALATGAPITPTLPARAGRGMVSLLRLRFVGLDGGDDGLDRDPSVGDELTTRTPGRRRERCRPQVSHEHPGRAARLHRRGEVLDVLPRPASSASSASSVWSSPSSPTSDSSSARR